MGKEGIEIKISTLPVIGLTLLFSILKLFNIITWPWIWVFSPIWVTICGVLFIIIVAIVALSIVSNDDFLSHWGDDE